MYSACSTRVLASTVTFSTVKPIEAGAPSSPAAVALPVPVEPTKITLPVPAPIPAPEPAVTSIISPTAGTATAVPSPPNEPHCASVVLPVVRTWNTSPTLAWVDAPLAKVERATPALSAAPSA